MTENGFSVLSLPVVAALLAVLALALLFLGRLWGLGIDSLFLLAVPVALAIAYLAWYRTLPYEPRPAARAPAAVGLPVDNEPFEDPVEEADELDRAAVHGGATSNDDEGAEPATAEDTEATKTGSSP